jgi:hypothetical protein
MNFAKNSTFLFSAVRGGLFYGAGVFIIGFGLGGVRTVAITPFLGSAWAVVVEVPIILGLSWLVCSRSILKLEVAKKVADRILMGLAAFIFLMSAELVLWLIMFDGTLPTFFARYTALAGIIGLIAQLLFALFPLMQLKIPK